MGIIQKLTSLAVSLMLFVLKKNKKLQPCVDYQKLNEIIIKNQYLLLSGPQLQN